MRRRVARANGVVIGTLPFFLAQSVTAEAAQRCSRPCTQYSQPRPQDLRYPGCCDAMRFLLRDLRLIERRDLLRQVLAHAMPHSRKDVVIVFASTSGLRGEQRTADGVISACSNCCTKAGCRARGRRARGGFA
ncbi:MAG: hypothetical protein ACRYGA_05765 [Janthinobacterium lividum]